jgi:hypothetical protein
MVTVRVGCKQYAELYANKSMYANLLKLFNLKKPIMLYRRGFNALHVSNDSDRVPSSLYRFCVGAWCTEHNNLFADYFFRTQL